MSKLPTPKRFRKKYVAQRRSPIQEKSKAQSLGAIVVKGSGCGDVKGDVRKKGVLRLEMKTTQNKSFSITREMVRKIENAGLGSDEIPAMEIEFLHANGTPEMSVCVVPTYIIELLMGIKDANNK